MAGRAGMKIKHLDTGR